MLLCKIFYISSKIKFFLFLFIFFTTHSIYSLFSTFIEKIPIRIHLFESSYLNSLTVYSSCKFKMFQSVLNFEWKKTSYLLFKIMRRLLKELTYTEKKQYFLSITTLLFTETYIRFSDFKRFPVMSVEKELNVKKVIDYILLFFLPSSTLFRYSKFWRKESITWLCLLETIFVRFKKILVLHKKKKKTLERHCRHAVATSNENMLNSLLNYFV